MRDERVEALTPSSFAAPFSPETFHFAASSARMIFARSSSSSSFAVRMIPELGLACTVGCGWCGSCLRQGTIQVQRPSVAVITARSITFCSSRTFPGQL